MVCEKKKGRFIGTSRKNSSILEADFCSPVTIERLSVEMFSYDVTTSSEHFTVSGLYSHNCRSFLAPWKNEKGEYQFEGRFNQVWCLSTYLKLEFLPRVTKIHSGNFLMKDWNSALRL